MRGLCLAAGLASAGVAGAQEPPLGSSTVVAAVSLTAPDVDAAARFYESVFGFVEIRRIDERPKYLEVVLKPGADARQARLAPGAALILISRPSHTPAGPPGLDGWARARLVLVIPEMAAALDRAAKSGCAVAVAPYTAQGSLQSEVETHPNAAGTHVDAMIEDPAGNFVELLAPR
jgi:catechol 2,3-dioxygenase-like lactoylglutathione lyase family enzyme